MSGPIVRTGTTPAFWENWDQMFGTDQKKKKKKKAAAAKSKTAKKKKKK